MINEERVRQLIINQLDGSDKFLTEVKVKTGNKVLVFIDGDHGIKIEDCISLTHFLESQFDRDTEDYELQVSSAGADQPLLFMRQYIRHTGRELDIVQVDGTNLKGRLLSADVEGVEIEILPEKKGKGKSSKLIEKTILKVLYPHIRQARVILSFK